MLKSMTGYGKANIVHKGKKISVEIRSLNSKQMDVNFHIPFVYREKETALRTLVAEKIIRGKIDFSVFMDSENEETVKLNRKAAERHHRELKSICKKLKIDDEEILLALLQIPDVLKAKKKSADVQEWKKIFSAAGQAIKLLNRHRIAEGKCLERDFKKRIQTILHLLKSIDTLDEKRIPSIKEKIRKQVAEISKIPDENRLEQELIYYAEKLDITEEKVRLKTHCDYFLKTMNENDSGRKLSFIAQEMGREINTLGSKANDAAIQQRVVQMKDELEKIKEQLNNVL